MRLVKATRRRSWASAALLLVLAACARKPVVAETDCSGTILRPGRPHIVSVAPLPGPGGQVEQGPACASGFCFTGNDGVFVWRDGQDTLHVEVGARALQIPVQPASILRASHSIAGVMIGDGRVGIDRGDTLEVIDVGGHSITVPTPTIPSGTELVSPALIDGTLVASIIGAIPEGTSRRVVLHRDEGAPPLPAGHLVVDEHHHVIGTFVGGERAAVISLDGTRTELGLALDPAASVHQARDAFVIATHTQRFVVVPGKPPIELNALTDVFIGKSAVIVVDRTVPGSVFTLVSGVLAPAFEGTATADLAGDPFPPGAKLLRIEAGAHDDTMILAERIQLASCGTEDHILMLDVVAHEKVIVARDGQMKMHPMYAGSRFRWAEADPEVSLP